MTRWQYCQISWMERVITEKERQEIQQTGFSGDVREQPDGMGGSMVVARSGTFRLLDRLPDTVEKFHDLPSMITRLGLDGWELVSETSINAAVRNFYFKRPIE